MSYQDALLGCTVLELGPHFWSEIIIPAAGRGGKRSRYHLQIPSCDSYCFEKLGTNQSTFATLSSRYLTVCDTVSSLRSAYVVILARRKNRSPRPRRCITSVVPPFGDCSLTNARIVLVRHTRVRCTISLDCKNANNARYECKMLLRHIYSHSAGHLHHF